MEIDIKNYIENQIPELKDKIHAVFTTETKYLTLAYNFSPLTGGHVKQSQLELKIIWSDYDECERIRKVLMDILDFEEDASFIKFNKTYFKSTAAGGGGCLFNEGPQMFERTIYFIIKYRRIN